jgi:hypothetical protein
VNEDTAMRDHRLAALAGSSFSGDGELWLDPLGNDAARGPCSMTIEPKAARYTWQHEGNTHTGTFELLGGGVRWSDTFPQPTAVTCREIPDAQGIFAVHCTWSVGGGPDWGWRTVLSERPDGSLVLQMTNITAWGEEARAVRIVFARAKQEG